MKRHLLRRTLTGLVTACLCSLTPGFTVAPTPVGTRRYAAAAAPPAGGSTSPRPRRRAAASARMATDSNVPAPLSHEEQQELLREAVQLRLLKRLRQDFELRRQDDVGPPSPRELARASGFGDDTDAYDAALRRGQAAREELIATNLRLVHYCVSDILKGRARQPGSGDGAGTGLVSREDLVQEGVLGLAQAVDRWDLAIGGRFSTYAVYWIRAAVLRGLAERGNHLRVPERMVATLRRVKATARDLGIEFQGDAVAWGTSGPSDPRWRDTSAAQALAAEAGLTERQLAVALQVRQQRQKEAVSLESWLQSGREVDWSRAIDPLDSDGPVSDDAEYLADTLARFLQPKEMEALSWRYGLIHKTADSGSERSVRSEPRDYLAEAEAALFGSPETTPPLSPPPQPVPQLAVRGKDGEAMSFAEVGMRMQVSAEYTRRLVKGALSKLRRAAADGRLGPALMGS